MLIFLQKQQKWLKRWHSPKRVIAKTAQLGTRVEAKAEDLKEESELCRFYTCVYDSKHLKCKWSKKRSLFPTVGALSTPERPTAPQQMKTASPPLPQLLEQPAGSDTRFASPHLLWSTSNTQNWQQGLINLREYRRTMTARILILISCVFLISSFLKRTLEYFKTNLRHHANLDLPSVCVLPAWMYMYYVYVWCPQKAKEGTELPGTGLTNDCDLSNGCWDPQLLSHPPTSIILNIFY